MAEPEIINKPRRWQRIAWRSLAVFVLTLIGLYAFAFWRYEEQQPSDVSVTNQTRRRIGVREIQNTWQFYGREFDQESWVDGSGVLQKSVIRRAGSSSIVLEADAYYSGKTFTPRQSEGPSIEVLYILYNYREETFYIGYDGPNKKIIKTLDLMHATRMMGYNKGDDNAETLSIADGVLKGWNVPRLQLPPREVPDANEE